MCSFTFLEIVKEYEEWGYEVILLKFFLCIGWIFICKNNYFRVFLK